MDIFKRLIILAIYNSWRFTLQLFPPTICYNYDSLDRLISTWQTNGSDSAYTYYTYDDKGRVTEYNCKMSTNGINLSQNYAYNYDSKDNLLNSMTVNNDSISYTYDAVERLAGKTVTGTGINLQNTYSYHTKSGSYMTQQIAEHTVSIHNTTVKEYRYTYDNLGNITGVYWGDTLIYGYEYDEQGQLTSEIWWEDDIAVEYIYDDYGNMLGFKEYNADKSIFYIEVMLYEYENSQWKDRLTSYDGVDFTYDAIGNPRYYYNGYDYTFTWKNGRELASAVKGNTTITYKYGADGLRTQKKVGNTVYDYYYSDGLLMRQTWGSNYIDFLYDESGLAYSFIYNGVQYYYVKNIQGDVVAITNFYGTVVVEYDYDAWGSGYAYGSMASTVGAVNPIRYRSYYYDTDTGFYYLQSRYYDPTIKRFINADGYVNANGDILGFNMYAYCGNNPVMYVDYSGEFPWLVIGIIAAAFIVDAIVETAVLMISDNYKAENYSPDETNQNIQIENSDNFDNPIAQFIYSKYLYENVKNKDGSNFFTGNVYDIVGEWQAHNLASDISLLTMSATFIPCVLTSSGGEVFMDIYDVYYKSRHVDLGPNLNVEKDSRPYVYYASEGFKWINVIFSFNILNWG